jgi:hypothetical protein
MASYTLAQQHTITRSWAPTDQRLELLAEEHQIDLDLTVDRALADARRHRFGPSHPADLFLNSWQTVRPGLDVMLSMRYENGDPGRPFVDVSVSSRAITEPADISATVAAATDRFGELHPRYLRWWTSLPAGRIPGTGQDKRFLAAPICELTNQSVPDQLSLRPAANLGHYDQAAAAYRSLDRQHPQHAEQASVERADDLADLVRARTLYEVMVDDQWAGYIAAKPGHKFGLPGYKITELILADHARGHDYGRHLTTLLARALARLTSVPGMVLIGTIHHHNVGAIQAARQAGRHDIGGWTTVTI